MKKPKFIPSGQFKSKPELPDNLEDAHRLLAQLREYHDSLQIEASHLQSIIDEGANARLAKKLQGKNNFQNKPKKG